MAVEEIMVIFSPIVSVAVVADKAVAVRKYPWMAGLPGQRTDARFRMGAQVHGLRLFFASRAAIARTGGWGD
jgi:hypothetical protein